MLLVSVALERRNKIYVFEKTDVFLVLKIWQDLAWICFLEGDGGVGSVIQLEYIWQKVLETLKFCDKESEDFAGIYVSDFIRHV